MLETKEEVKEVQGRPWKNAAFCTTFDEADTKRNKLIKEDKEGKFQIKVKKLSDRFVVKIRNKFVEEKKDAKTKKRKKNAVRRSNSPS